MSKHFVLLGDKTTHGGSVMSASATHTVNGVAVALVGDQVSCPMPGHGTNKIVEGCVGWSEAGVALVVDGCRSKCGAVVQASTCDCAAD